ncbi:unnamed protein product, partial [Prorocentrum cordatum]
ASSAWRASSGRRHSGPDAIRSSALEHQRLSDHREQQALAAALEASQAEHLRQESGSVWRTARTRSARSSGCWPRSSRPPTGSRAPPTRSSVASWRPRPASRRRWRASRRPGAAPPAQRWRGPRR